MVSPLLHVKHLNLLRSLPYRCIKSVTAGQSTGRSVKKNLQIGKTPRASREAVEEVLFTAKRRVMEQEVDMDLEEGY